MTFEQIKKILDDRGLDLETWLTFENIDGQFEFGYFPTSSDRTIFIDPKSVQFWFSDLPNGNYMLMRRTHEKPIASEALPNDGYVSLSHKGASYHIKLERGGKIHPNAGRFHEIFSLETLVGVMYK